MLNFMLLLLCALDLAVDKNKHLREYSHMQFG